jgi:hypothetical protein
VDIALGDLGQGCAGRRHDEVPDGNGALEAAVGIHNIEVIGAVRGWPEDTEVVDSLLDADVLVEGDEAAGHKAAGGLIAVLEEFGDFVAAVELGEGLSLLFGSELLNDVGDDIVLDLFENGGEFVDADATDEVAQFVVFDKFEELADDIGGEVGEEFAAFGFAKVEDEFGEVGRVEGGYEGDKLRPLAGVCQ